jgi:hypothetical protein
MAKKGIRGTPEQHYAQSSFERPSPFEEGPFPLQGSKLTEKSSKLTEMERKRLFFEKLFFPRLGQKSNLSKKKLGFYVSTVLFSLPQAVKCVSWMSPFLSTP